MNISDLKINQMNYHAVYVYNFKKRVDLGDIILSPFYHRYQFVRVDGPATNLAMQIHGSLPKNLVELELYNFAGEIKNLIGNLSKLRRLRVNRNCTLVLQPGCLPDKLTHCTWNCGQKLVRGILPDGLTHLDIDYYGHSDVSIPDSVQKLRLGTRFNSSDLSRTIDLKSLPTELKVLVMENLIFPTSYPENLKKIVYGTKIKHFRHSNLPNHINVIQMKEHPDNLLYGL